VTGLQTILTAVSVGNITIACGPSSFLGGTNGHRLKLTALLVKNLLVECLECYLCVSYTVLLCGVRHGFNCSRRIECRSLCYTALSQLTRLYVCLKRRPIKCTYIYTQNIYIYIYVCVCVCVCMYVYMFVCMYTRTVLSYEFRFNRSRCRLDQSELKLNSFLKPNM